MKFVHLHNHSHYSLLDGLSKIDDMVARTKALGMDAIAITDHGNLYGSIEFYQKAKKAKIKPILGMEAYVAPGNRRDKGQGTGDPDSKINKNPKEEFGMRNRLPYYHLILLAENDAGWKNLIKLATKASLEGFYYKPRIDKELLREHHEGLIALSGCMTGEISRLLLADKFSAAENAVKEYVEIFGPNNFFLEIGHHPAIKELKKINEGLILLSKKTGVPLCATQDSHYLLKEDAPYHDILLAVQTGNKLTDEDRLTLKDDDFSLRSPEEMELLFKEHPEAIESTVKIAERCNVELELGKIRLPSFPLPDGVNPMSHLRELINLRIGKRFPGDIKKEVYERLEFELGVIDSMKYANYFLIVQDFINWAKERGIVVGPGRGSAAGSLVSYVLGITEVDPLKYDLYFERFLNPERIQMPDIDIDFTDLRRDEVLSYVKEKYGEDRVAQIITFGTMAARAAIRDSGRALGMPYSLCDQIAKMLPLNFKFKDGIENIPDLKALYLENPDAKQIINAARKLEGVARHASVHACGVVISKDPLIEIVPLQLSPQDQTSIITQFEMHAIEDLGLLKMDFLGLKNLTIMEETIRLVYDIHGQKINITEIPIDDLKTFEFLKQGETTGVFQFEGSGMRRYMKELKPTELEDLIALVALYRPGPMELIPTYIKRKNGEEKVSYIHPIMEKVLKNTYGVIVYQEQVMAMATELAGLTKGEGYLLIKAVGKKIKSLLDEQKEKFINGCLKNNITPSIAKTAWELIEPFARYGFNKAHSTCYALIGYQTAYLKANYPIEYMTALFDADKNDVERISFLTQEAGKIGIKVLPPDINTSSRDFMPDGSDIRFGLLAIKNVGGNIVDAIVNERARGGNFTDFSEFITRVEHKDLNKKSLESLARCGVFDSLNIDRNSIIENIEDILKFIAGYRRSSGNSNHSLFQNNLAKPKLELKQVAEALPTDKLKWEKELIGLYISDHPLNQFKDKIEKSRARPIKDALLIKNQNLKFFVAGIVASVKKINDKKGRPMLFVRMEDLNNEAEVIVFSSVYAKNPALWQENTPLLLQAKTNWRNGEAKLICDSANEL